MPIADADALAVEIVRETTFFGDFARAYGSLSKMALNLAPPRPLESRTCFCYKAKENPFCSKVTQDTAGAEACLRIQNSGLSRAAHHGSPAMTRCFSGLIDLYIPVIVHGHHVATLVSGQVAQRPFKTADIKPFKRLLKSWGMRRGEAGLCKALLASPLLDYSNVDAACEILKLFALELSQRWEQFVVLPKIRISNAVQKGLDIVRQNYTDPKLDMGTASKMIGLNHFYFCKIFKKEIGIGFLEYLNRERIRHAQKMLANPAIRIKEIVYKSGFQSLATFNRVFKKQSGVTPSEYRDDLFTASSES